MLLARRLAGGKDKAGPVKLVFDACRDDADHAFIKFGVEHTNGRWRFVVGVEQGLGYLHGHVAHIAFYDAAIAAAEGE